MVERRMLLESTYTHTHMHACVHTNTPSHLVLHFSKCERIHFGLPLSIYTPEKTSQARDRVPHRGICLQSPCSVGTICEFVLKPQWSLSLSLWVKMLHKPEEVSLTPGTHFLKVKSRVGCEPWCQHPCAETTGSS